jgi:hypothetical protein
LISAGRATAIPGARVRFEVRLHTRGNPVVSVQNDIIFAAPVWVDAKANGRPACSVNPGIDKGATAFAFQPPGCTPGVDCTRVRALVVAFDNLTPIADGTLLYTCIVRVAAAAPTGTYALRVTTTSGSGPNAEYLPADGRGGAIVVPSVSRRSP